MAEELSDSDSDDFGLGEDMEALRRACSLGIGDYGGSSGVFLDDSSSEWSDGDLELYKNIRARFSGGKDDEEPLNLKPICVLPPVSLDSDDDDCDGDFEILRDIQRRFSDDCKENCDGSVVTDLDKESLDCNVLDSGVCGREIEADLVEPEVIDDCSPGREEETGLPKSAQAFLDAIKKNRLCQKYLRSKLMLVESRIEENVKLRNRVKALKGLQFACRRRTGLEVSQKKDALLQLVQGTKLRVNAKVNEKSPRVMRFAPCENDHVMNYKAMVEKFWESVNRNKWTKQDDVNLVKGIKQQFQDMLLQKTYENAEGFSDSNEFDSIVASISDHDITDENLNEFLPKVNWEQLASMYTKGRSGAECEARWLNCTNPLINKNSWTKSEEKKLLYIIQHKGISNWIDIASSLRTNRTPFQCLAHYQRSLNPSLLKQNWTEDEDEKLRAAVATYGESSWESVASVFEGRTGTQCSNRWTKALHPTRKRIGKWIPNEDKRLKVAVTFFGAKSWRKVAHYVPGRDHVQCRERWKNSLDPCVKLDYWTSEEDQRLEEAYEEFGPSWNKIASYVTQRTDNQCLRRWKVLFPEEFPKLQVARKIKKIALPSNFVDREARRPALGPSDFVHLQLLDSALEAKKTDSSKKRKRKSRQPVSSAKRTDSCERKSRKTVSSANNYVSKLRPAKQKKDAQQSCEGDKPPIPEVHPASKKSVWSRKKKTRSESSESFAAFSNSESKRKPCENESIDIKHKKVRNRMGIDATKKRKTLIPSLEKNILTEKVKEVQVHTESHETDVLSEHLDISIFGDCLQSPSRSPERMLLNGDVAEPFFRDNNDERPLRCSTPEILENLNPRASTVCRKRQRRLNSKQMRNVGYRDDMTVSSVSNQLRRSQRIEKLKLRPNKCYKYQSGECF
ncbi:hypothetical protein ACET3Z_027862 [Daucus carota]